jgi:septal ring factor EnvC (AmiA/AmiB activator)
MKSEAEIEREKAQNERDSVVKTISSLEDSIALLDNDIKIATEKVNRTNTDIIKVKAEADSNARNIELLKQKVNENTEILLEYLVYIHKKSNTAYNE